MYKLALYLSNRENMGNCTCIFRQFCFNFYATVHCTDFQLKKKVKLIEILNYTLDILVSLSKECDNELLERYDY